MDSNFLLSLMIENNKENWTKFIPYDDDFRVFVYSTNIYVESSIHW